MTYSSGRDASKNFTLEELLKIFNDIGSAKDNILEGDLNLESYIAICQGIEKIFTSYFLSYRVRGREVRLKLFLNTKKQRL